MATKAEREAKREEVARKRFAHVLAYYGKHWVLTEMAAFYDRATSFYTLNGDPVGARYHHRAANVFRRDPTRGIDGRIPSQPEFD